MRRPSSTSTSGTSSATCTCSCRDVQDCLRGWPSPGQPRDHPGGRSGVAAAVALRAMNGQTTILVTLTGRDRPGVTSRLFTDLAAHELAVLDIEQVVIRGRLVLGVLLASDGE